MEEILISVNANDDSPNKKKLAEMLIFKKIDRLFRLECLVGLPIHFSTGLSDSKKIMKQSAPCASKQSRTSVKEKQNRESFTN